MRLDAALGLSVPRRGSLPRQPSPVIVIFGRSEREGFVFPSPPVLLRADGGLKAELAAEFGERPPGVALSAC